MAESDKSGWYASVKYILDEKKEYAPISAISEIGPGGVKTPFRPATLTDFKAGKVYCVKTTTGRKDGRIHPYNGIIGRLAESKEAMKNDKVRTIWPPITHEMRTFSEPESSGTEESTKRQNNILVKSRNQNRSVLINKKQAQAKELENLAARKFFDLPDDRPVPLEEPVSPLSSISSSSPSCSTIRNSALLSSSSRLPSSPPSNTTLRQNSTSPTSISGRADLVETMQERIKFFEEQLEDERKAKASKTNLQEMRDYIDEKFKDLTGSIQNTIDADVDKKVAPLADFLSKSSSPTNKPYVQEFLSNVPVIKHSSHATVQL